MSSQNGSGKNAISPPMIVLQKSPIEKKNPILFYK